MKKKLIAMAIAASLSVTAGVAFAANPFTDVPAKHWSYDAVAQLAKAGVIDGYNDGTFRGEKTITRYEMAVIVAKAMAKEQTANANTKAVIDKLAAEYSDELTNLGVRVSALEAKTGNVTFGGTARLRYDNEQIDGVTQSAVDRNLNIELVGNAKINEDWNSVIKFEGNRTYNNSSNAEQNAHITKYYVQGKFMGGNLLVGKDGFTPGYKVLLDNDITGVRYTFGNVVKATAWQGTLAAEARDTLAQGLDKDVKTYGLQLSYAASDKTNVNFVGMNAKASTSGVERKFYELGADTKLGKDFTLAGAYARSNADSAKTAYMAQLTYKAANTKVVGSYDIWAKYAKNEAYAVLKGGNDIDANQKGYQFGFEYVPMENTKFTAWYFKKNAVDTSLNMPGQTGDADNKYRAQLEFFF